MKLPRAAAVVSTVFGIGYFPQAQGTIMSAIAVPLAILLAHHWPRRHGGGGRRDHRRWSSAFCPAPIMCAKPAITDPSECVIDELAGQWLACAFVAFRALVRCRAFFLSFVLFRLFDIWKPWPVYLAETKLHGGLAVMMDDIVAGLMAGVLSFAVHYYQLAMMFSEALARPGASSSWTQARAKGLRIVTAESCTGGLIAGLLTEIPGSSDVVERGFVTYSNEAKEDLLGVPARSDPPTMARCRTRWRAPWRKAR